MAKVKFNYQLNINIYLEIAKLILKNVNQKKKTKIQENKKKDIKQFLAYLFFINKVGFNNIGKN